MYSRWYTHVLRQRLTRPFVQVVFGPRQAGKSTLIHRALPPEAMRIDLADPRQHQRLQANPGELVARCEALPPRDTPYTVFIDEAQKVPALFDAVQFLYDADRREGRTPPRFRFVLCGSSARRLRTSGANLLPGRSQLHHLHPLVLDEHPAPGGLPEPRLLPLPPPPPGADDLPPFPAWDLLDRLAYGGLPGVVAAAPEDRAEVLRSYAAIHLAEEVRNETALRDLGAFLRFVRLAALESGQVINYSALAQEVGLTHNTVKGHYQILEDMFLGTPLPAFTRSPRKGVLSTPRFLFFDLGVRHAAADLTPSHDVVRANPGPIFEQWVALELWRRLKYLGDGQLWHFRTKDGSEVDLIVERGGHLTPIEVKWTEHPQRSDARHLLSFLRDHPDEAAHGYVVCRCPHAMRLDDRVTALPWQCL